MCNLHGWAWVEKPDRAVLLFGMLGNSSRPGAGVVRLIAAAAAAAVVAAAAAAAAQCTPEQVPHCVQGVLSGCWCGWCRTACCLPERAVHGP